MTDTGHRNTAWQARVRQMMEQGAGYDDIAVKLGCDPALIRAEAEIYRQEGRLDEIYRTWRKAKAPPG